MPKWLIRKRIENAVARIKCTLRGRSKTALVSGFISGSPTSVVIPLVDELNVVLVEYWESVCETEEEAEEVIKSREKWFGIVDGCHLHAGIMELRDECPSEWKSFVWKVTVLRHTPNLVDLRKMARVQNERNKPIYSYDTTIYDLLHGLRLEYDLLKAERSVDSRTDGVVINSRDVAQAYDGGEHQTNTSIRQAANIAIKLHPRTIQALGEVVNSSLSLIHI